MDQVLEREDRVGRVFEGPARCGGKGLVSILISETPFSALSIVCYSAGVKTPVVVCRPF